MHAKTFSSRITCVLRLLVGGALLLLLLALAGGIRHAPVANADPLAEGDNRWSVNFSLTGPEGPVYALALSADNTRIFVGGSFYRASGQVVRNIAAWNPVGWSSLGYGLDGDVTALAVDGSNLYVGGAFHGICYDAPCTTKIPANHIAKWNGLQWSALSYGLNDTVAALAADTTNHRVYAGGALHAYCGNMACNSGNTTANHIAMWNANTSTWSTVGNGLNSDVYAFAYDASTSTLYAGGAFTAYCTDAGCSTWTEADYVARWNGVTWSAHGLGLDGPVRALAAVGGGFAGLYAGGDFHHTDYSTVANHIAKYEAPGWKRVGGSTTTGLDATVYSLVLDSSQNLYAGGDFSEICLDNNCYDGTGSPASHVVKYVAGGNAAPTPLGAGVSGAFGSHPVRALLTSPTSVYAAGELEIAGSVPAWHIARWTGTAWVNLSQLGQGMSNIVSAIAADASGNVYAGGDFGAAGPIVARGLAKYNGISWSAPAPVPGYWARAIALAGNGDIYAAYYNTLYRWTSSSGWTTFKLANGFFNALVLDASNHLYVGGSFDYLCGTDCSSGLLRVNGIAEWDGTNWSGIGNGFSTAGVNALAFDSNGVLYAGGSFLNACADLTCATSNRVNRVARWTGTTWAALGSGVNGDVRALAADANGRLYVAGAFSHLCPDGPCATPGTQMNHIARWSNSAWSAMGHGVHDPVNALALDRFGSLYVGGEFTRLCANSTCSETGEILNHVAKWNGAIWSTLGSGTDGTVNALAVDARGYLDVGGAFTQAGGKSSVYFGRFQIIQPLFLPLVRR